MYLSEPRCGRPSPPHPPSAVPGSLPFQGALTAMSEPQLDVRTIAPRDRHPQIFGTFESLALGGAFILVNDHDPKPLYYHFNAERAGTFGWEYLEDGPEVWRVRISRTA